MRLALLADEWFEAAYASLAHRASISREAFNRLLAGAELHRITVENKPCGLLVVKSHEIHACVAPEAFGRWLGKKALRVLDAVIERHGYATTAVTAGNSIGDQFVRRLGFIPCEETPTVIHYRCTRKWVSKQQSAVR